MLLIGALPHLKPWVVHEIPRHVGHEGSKALDTSSSSAGNTGDLEVQQHDDRSQLR